MTESEWRYSLYLQLSVARSIGCSDAVSTFNTDCFYIFTMNLFRPWKTSRCPNATAFSWHPSLLEYFSLRDVSFLFPSLVAFFFPRLRSSPKTLRFQRTFGHRRFVAQKVWFLRSPINFIFYSIHKNFFNFCFMRILLAIFTIFYSQYYLMSTEWSILFRKRVLHAKNLALAVEDSDRLLGKVDIAAPDKAMLVMRTSRFHPYSSDRAPLSMGEYVI